MDRLGGVCSGSASEKKSMLRALGGRLVTRLKKPHLDLTFAVLKAGDHLESEGKLQLTRGNSKINADTSGDWGLPCSTPCPGCLAGPYPQQRSAGQAFCLKMALLY